MICGLCLIPVGFVIGFSIPIHNKIPISCVGSSGVKPFVEITARDYAKVNKSVDVTVEAGGSGFGIQQIAASHTKIGDASENPYHAVSSNEDLKQSWISNNIKTVSIGREAICMLYNPPKNFKFNENVKLNNLLSLNDTNIYNFFRIFSGIDTNITWPSDTDIAKNSMYHFVNPTIKSLLDQQQINLLKKTTIRPFVRTGGSLTSGTASSFYNCPLLSVYDPKGLTQQQINAFSTGDYGLSFNIQQTMEANSRAWSMFDSSNLPGDMVYLSSGFVSQTNNWDLIKHKNYGVCAYNQVVFSSDFPTGYNWLRPLNCMFSLNKIENNDSDIPKFIEYLVKNVQGCKKNTDDENISMFGGSASAIDWNAANWKSDVQIAQERNSGWNWNDSSTIFGAHYD